MKWKHIILEGFTQCKKVHTLHWWQRQLRVPNFNSQCTNLEPCNQEDWMCKPYLQALLCRFGKLVQAHPHYKGKGGLTQRMRRGLTSVAWCAIKMHSQEADTRQAVKFFWKGSHQWSHHCFGYHDNCSPDFCSTPRERMQQMSSLASLTDNNTMEHPNTDDDTDVTGMCMHSSNLSKIDPPLKIDPSMQPQK